MAMKKSSYMTRAMKAQDPRYARVLSRLGYERTDLAADDAPPARKTAARPSVPSAKKAETGDDMAALRKQYQAVIGKKPFGGWDAETLKAKIAEASKA
jgi:hypothetical protein